MSAKESTHAGAQGAVAPAHTLTLTETPDAGLSKKEAKERHVPVMLTRCLDLLAPALEREGAVVIDGTLGMGGHTEAMLERFPELRVIGIDRDPQAHTIAGQRLERFGERFIPVHAVYDQVEYAMDVAGVNAVDGVLFDLGVSSMQLDERSRGFAYSYDAPLDMRMNSEDELTARTVVNEYPLERLRRIIRTWGEEKFAARIAERIVAQRAVQPFETTGELVAAIQKAVPAAAQRKGGHPAKRTFQALRIEVNHELEALERAVPVAINSLSLGGRFVAMSYHSLEDKIVKRGLSAAATSKAPKGFPVELDEHKPTMKVITRGAEPPTEAEIAENSRAASAKLRGSAGTRPNPRVVKHARKGQLLRRAEQAPHTPGRLVAPPQLRQTPAAPHRRKKLVHHLGLLPLAAPPEPAPPAGLEQPKQPGLRALVPRAPLGGRPCWTLLPVSWRTRAG